MSKSQRTPPQPHGKHHRDGIAVVEEIVGEEIVEEAPKKKAAKKKEGKTLEDVFSDGFELTE